MIEKKMISIIKFFKISILALLLVLGMSGCGGLLIGGAATVGVASVQERSLKDATLDMKIKLFIEDKLFITNTEELFAKVSVSVIEQRVMLVGAVASEELRDKAAEIAWKSPKIKEVLNEITTGKGGSLVDSAKDARISITLSGLLLTESEIADINFTHSVSNQVIYIMGIAQNKNETDKVIHHARTVKGVKKVISHILIKNDKKRL
tara:strand:+ start:277 stop:897 length:621 start_codon:yes stop_codon:yes gene_type:complete